MRTGVFETLAPRRRLRSSRRRCHVVVGGALALLAMAPSPWWTTNARAAGREASITAQASDVPAEGSLSLSTSPPVAAAADLVEPRPPAEPKVVLFYLFSPDWRPPDFGKFTVAFETALSSGGDWSGGERSGGDKFSVQAFTRYEDFERQAIVNSPTFLLAPAWLETPGASTLASRFRVIAHPQRHGKGTYRKALMTRANVDSIDDLARGSIAATLYSMGPGAPAVVLDAFHLATDSARVIPVPKDVDAMLALSFGQVDAALVTSEQYDLLARNSPAEAARLRVLAFSPEVPLPPVFAGTGADAELSGRLLEVLGKFQETDSGRTVLGMLGFDGFVGATDAKPLAVISSSAANSPASPKPKSRATKMAATKPTPTPTPTPTPAATATPKH